MNTNTNEKLPADVKAAFGNWMKANHWKATLTRQEQGKLGAAKRALNAALRKHGLAFDEVAQTLV